MRPFLPIGIVTLVALVPMGVGAMLYRAGANGFERTSCNWKI
jgi:hypothetical protein